MGLWRQIRLRWRRLGHGVHSPQAYAFIRDVIAERKGYYDYDSLPSAQQRLLYRIAVYVGTPNMRLVGIEVPPTLPTGPAQHGGLAVTVYSARHEADFLAECRATPRGWAFAHPGRIYILLTPTTPTTAPQPKPIELKII